MKTVHDLDEDEFLARFNYDTPLEKTFEDTRMKREGLELLVVADKLVVGRYLLSVNGQAPAPLGRLNAYIFGLLIGLGYFSSDEAEDRLIISQRNVHTKIFLLKELTGKDRIHSRRGSELSKGGYYVGDISEHRQSHIRTWKGYSINKKTGHFVIAEVGDMVLNPTDTRFMGPLIENDGSYAMSDLSKDFYKDYDSLYRQTLMVLKLRMDRKLKEKFGFGSNIIYAKHGKFHLKELE